MRIRPQTQPTLASSCPVDRPLLRFPISDQSIVSSLFYCFLQLIISWITGRLADHDRGEASAAGRFPPLQRVSSSSSLPHRKEKKRKTANGTAPHRIIFLLGLGGLVCEGRSLSPVLLSASKKGIGGGRLRVLSFLGAGISSRSASAPALVAWWNGMEWDGRERTRLRQRSRPPTTCHFRRVRQHFLVWEKKGEWR